MSNNKTAKRLYEKLFKRKKEKFHASFTLNRVECSFTIETKDLKTAKYYLGVWERHVISENEQLHDLRMLAEQVKVEHLKLKVAEQVEEMDAVVQERKKAKRIEHQTSRKIKDSRDLTPDVKKK